MSVADAIRASVTEEWRSTTEIATECGVTSPRAYVVLSKLVKYGLVEKDLVSPCARPGGVVAVWRRVRCCWRRGSCGSWTRRA